MHKRILSLIFAGFCVASVVPAQAQTAGLTLKGGGFVQANSAAQGYGSSYLALGAEYDLVHPTAVSPFNVSVYGDIIGKSTGFGFSLRGAAPVYLGAGAGVYHTSIVPAGGGPGFIGLGGSAPATSSNGFGGKIFAGVALGKFAAFEAGYHILPRAGAINANALSAEFAARL